MKPPRIDWAFGDLGGRVRGGLSRSVQEELGLVKTGTFEFSIPAMNCYAADTRFH
jgi:hypothetical protein